MMEAWLRHSAWISLFLAVSACGPTLEPARGLRDTSVPMTSIVVLDTARMGGLWHEVAGYPLRGTCSGGTVGLTIEASGNACYLPLPEKGGTLSLIGPGRLTSDKGLEFWVLWVDADYRTLVLGHPSGGFGVILNRDAAIPPDRLTAAKKVLEWNGYDLGRLQQD